MINKTNLYSGRRILWQFFNVIFSRSVKPVSALLTMTGNAHTLVLEPDFKKPSVLKAVTTNGKTFIKLGLLPKVSLSSKVGLFWNCEFCKLLLKQSVYDLH